MRWLILAIGLGLVATTAPAASIQARLIRASENGGPTDPELEDIAAKLKRTFGYEHYSQLGRKQEPLEPGEKQRIDLGKGFTLFVKQKSAKDNRYELAVEWFGGRTLISKQTVRLSDQQYLFIKGPEVGKDWIILSLTVVE